MRNAIIWASSALMLICAAGASAAPPQLKGRYAVTGSAGCLAAPAFDSELRAAPPSLGNPVFSFSNSVLATRTYNGDGTGSVEGREVHVATNVPNSQGIGFAANAGSNEFSFAFTYDIDKNGIFSTEMVPGSFKGTVVTGPRAGQIFTVDTLSFKGQVSGDNKIIDVATIEPTVETVTYSLEKRVVYVRQQICHRSRVHVFLGQ